MKRKAEPSEIAKFHATPIKRKKEEGNSEAIPTLPSEEAKYVPDPKIIIAHTQDMKATLSFKVLKTFKFARASELILGHGPVLTPVYMPVGTKGAMKALTTTELEDLGCQIHLCNTYHLDLRPGPKKLAEYGGVHKFMGWRHNLLTDSGGFQMVSLNDLANITEKGVTFKSILDGAMIDLAPEDSIHVQNQIGADIMMALDDVVHVLVTGPRVEDSCRRSVRWLDRCIAAHGRPKEQSLFGIVQGSINPALRDYSLTGMTRSSTITFVRRVHQERSSGIRNRRTFRRRGQGHVLAHSGSVHRPSSCRQAALPHGSGVPRGHSGVCGPGMRHVRLRVRDEDR